MASFAERVCGILNADQRLALKNAEDTFQQGCGT
jgi:hypothetical protein